LAAFGRGTPDQRAEAYRQAVLLIWQKGGDRWPELVEFATLLGSITLDTLVMHKIIEEVGMSNAVWLADFFRDTSFGTDLVKQGREEGRGEGREELLASLLSNRFGTQAEIAEIAHRLAGWPESSAIDAAMTAKSLDQLAKAEPPDRPK
jgi:hypothetical protein